MTEWLDGSPRLKLHPPAEGAVATHGRDEAKHATLHGQVDILCTLELPGAWVNAQSWVLGPWAVLALAIAAATVLFSDANRFLPPVHEKYTDIAGAGGADLIPSFNAACALLDGVNPYRSDPVKYPDPFAYSRGADQQITYLYTPTHALVYVPFAILSGRSFDVAARMQFFFSLILMGVLGLAIADLIHAITPIGPELRVALALVSMFVLGLNPGNQLGLERGQSDLLTSALCWTAAALFCRGKLAIAIFLALAGGLLKGYGVALFGGLALLGLLSPVRAHRRAVILGSVAGFVVLLLPVARYLPDAAVALSIRTGMFWPGWVNQSLYALGHFLLPSAAGFLRYAVVVWSALVAALAFWRLRSVWLPGDTAPQARQRSALYVSMFTTAALTLILAFSSNSIAYDAVVVLPGALIIAAVQAAFSERGSRAERAIGAWLALTMFCLCAFSVHRLIGRSVSPYRELPTHALGLFSLSALIFSQIIKQARTRMFARHERLP